MPGGNGWCLAGHLLGPKRANIFYYLVQAGLAQGVPKMFRPGFGWGLAGVCMAEFWLRSGCALAGLDPAAPGWALAGPWPGSGWGHGCALAGPWLGPGWALAGHSLSLGCALAAPGWALSALWLGYGRALAGVCWAMALPLLGSGWALAGVWLDLGWRLAGPFMSPGLAKHILCSGTGLAQGWPKLFRQGSGWCLACVWLGSWLGLG